MRDVRIVPISTDSVTVQVTCNCGNSAMSRPGQERQFSFHIRINEPVHNDFVLYCTCGKQFHIVNQRTHIHVREEASETLVRTLTNPRSRQHSVGAIAEAEPR